jgi:hypothetical protein
MLIHFSGASAGLGPLDYADGINSPVSDEIGSPIDLKQGEMLLLSE